MDGLNGILDIEKEEEVKMEKIVSILTNKESKKIKQILLHWCYEIK